MSSAHFSPLSSISKQIPTWILPSQKFLLCYSLSYSAFIVAFKGRFVRHWLLHQSEVVLQCLVFNWFNIRKPLKLKNVKYFVSFLWMFLFFCLHALEVWLHIAKCADLNRAVQFVLTRVYLCNCIVLFLNAFYLYYLT